MLNEVVLMGRMTREADLRRTGTGKAVANLTVAVDRDYKDGEGQYGADFIDCVAWGPTAEFISRYFGKGDPIILTGRLQVRNWQDNDGNKRRSTEVIASHVYFAGGKKNSGQADSSQPQEDWTTPVDDDEVLPF